jgi:hypothetical protein
MNIESCLEQLATSRPAFHSEADFQHAFAWRIREAHPAWGVRLERCLRTGDESMHVDLTASYEEQTVALELKYKTVEGTFALADEEFCLKKHGALPQGRYDFWKDVSRLERLVRSKPRITGYALIVSSDRGYWNGSRKSGDVSESFSLKEGRIATGSLAWSPVASASTK